MYGIAQHITAHFHTQFTQFLTNVILQLMLITPKCAFEAVALVLLL